MIFKARYLYFNIEASFFSKHSSLNMAIYNSSLNCSHHVQFKSQNYILQTKLKVFLFQK